MAPAAVDAAGHVEGYEIFIKYLPSDTTEEPLRAFFAEAGEIVGAPRLMMNPQTGECKGIGWITFATEAAQAEALSWTGCAFGGRTLNITAGKAFHTGIRPSLQAAGTHTPAMLKQCVAKVVGSDASGVFVDGTFGRGGHSRGILEALSPKGRLHAFDMDPDAIAAGKELMKADPRFTIHHAPFSSMAKVMGPILASGPASHSRLHGAFFDLGISSPQFDEAHRGFRPEADGPLDLRFDNTKGLTAWEWLQATDREEIVRVVHEYGETTDLIAARRIADAICLARAAKALPKRTKEFAALVAEAKGKDYQPMHAAKLTFQALRVHLNDEFGEMRRGVRAACKVLGEGGRIGLITWKHSECAIVMEIFRRLEAVRAESPLQRWYKEQQKKAGEELPALPSEGCWALSMDDTTRPSREELAENSRSRSAVLHVLRKVHAPRMAHLEAIAYESLGWTQSADAAADEAEEKKERKENKKRKLQEELRQLEEEEEAGGEEEEGEVPVKKEKKEKKEKKRRREEEEEEEEVEKVPEAPRPKKEKTKSPPPAPEAAAGSEGEEEDEGEDERNAKAEKRELTPEEKERKRKRDAEKKGKRPGGAGREPRPRPDKAVAAPLAIDKDDLIARTKANREKQKEKKKQQKEAAPQGGRAQPAGAGGKKKPNRAEREEKRRRKEEEAAG